MSGALLDTCALILLARKRLSGLAASLLSDHSAAGQLYYSPISAWEIGELGRSRRDGPRLRFEPDPASWFDRVRVPPALQELPLSAEIAMSAALLPSEVHADPADRFLIATARLYGIPLATSDRRIIDLAAQGFLDVITCRPDPE